MDSLTALLRYFAISAAIVFTVAVIVAGYANRDRIKLKIASVFATVPPKAADVTLERKRHAGAVIGDAPWALSALPECFTQTSKTIGTWSFVKAHLAASAIPVGVPATLRYGDCVIRTAPNVVFVDRGEDRMRVPPPAKLYYLPGTGLALLRGGAQGRYDLRTYRIASALP